MNLVPARLPLAVLLSLMGDWIGLGIIVLVVVGALVGLSYLGKPRRPMTTEEYEERVQEARGTTRSAAVAGMQALQKLMNPKAAEAVEVIKDLKAGHYDDKQTQGEGGDSDTDEGADSTPEGDEARGAGRSRPADATRRQQTNLREEDDA